MKKAVFFDRDGVLNYPIKRDNQETAPWTFQEFKMIPGSIEAVQIAKDMGYLTLVVTNQPDVLDKKMNQEDLDKINKSLVSWLHVDEIMCALERNTDLYKPNCGMIDHFVQKYNLNREECYIIGDRWKDIVCGHNAKIKTIFIGDYNNTEWPEEHKQIKPDYVTDNVLNAVKIIGDKK